MECLNERSGVALRWEPTHDDGMVSFCGVIRGGKGIGHAATGIFYFDPGTNLDNCSEIVAVHRDGNRSKKPVLAG
jgi:hypothetical protein